MFRQTLIVVFLVLLGCTTPFPVEEGYVVTLSHPNPELSSNQQGYDETLRLTWLGTASYHIQLGDSALLTDPFYSHHSLLTTAFGELDTQTNLVQELLGPLREPSAIFVGHSHYDHLMDAAAAININRWKGIEIYGSLTTKSILGSYNNRNAWIFREVETNPEWHVTADSRLQYRAMLAKHAPQIDGILLFNGHISDRIDDPPTRAKQFLTGNVYAYLFKLTKGPKTFTIFFTSAATPFTENLKQQLGNVAPVDIAILCVPSWKKALGYPNAFLKELRPRYIIVSHFNDFFVDYDKRRTLRLSDLDGFVKEVQRGLKTGAYNEFEGIVIPDLNVTMQFTK